MRYDIIIIGAGAAGLTAARALTGSGRRVCLLEARPRIGGRVHTLRDAALPVPIELGPEFIHGEVRSTLDLVEAAALPVAQLPDNHWWCRDGRWDLIDFWDEISSLQKEVAKLRRDISVDELLRTRRRLDPFLRQVARTFVEGYHAAHADRISARVLASADSEQEEESPGANAQFRFAGGYDQLMQWLRAGTSPERFDLWLGTIVKRVEWSEGRVNAGGFRAKALLVTVPAGVLKEGSIEFDPPLREKEHALAKIESGHIVKIVFRFRERFWDEPDFLIERARRREDVERGLPLNFVHTTDRFMPTWWTTAPLRTPLLTGWAGGHAADALLAEGEEAMRERALDAMSRAFRVPRRTIDDLLVETYHHDWQRDPFSRGAYSYAAVGGEHAHAQLAKPLRRTLFFAGEATSGDQTGTVAGAIESGQRAAREILRALG